MAKVFIDGSAGTTGLRIYERLGERSDIELIILPDEIRKSTEARADALHRADVAFLCLPDDAAREAVELARGSSVAIIDTSTAHRTLEGWEYGFPELHGRRERIMASKRIGNPGCHASGYIALVEPLVRAGVLSPDSLLDCISLTGYSGGGKKMIAEYEAEDHDTLLDAPRMYGLTQAHKHLKEMTVISGVKAAPTFAPIVAPFLAGMEVTVPMHKSEIATGIEGVREIYSDYYKSGVVKFVPAADEGGFLSAAALSGRDDMQITVVGTDERMMLVARYDNLGKGASGAAIQNMNLLIGAPECAGLCI